MLDLLTSETTMTFRKYMGFVGADEDGVGFSKEVGAAGIGLVTILDLTLQEFLPLDGFFNMIPFLLREAILGDVC